jgi:hypothetical protein
MSLSPSAQQKGDPSNVAAYNLTAILYQYRRDQEICFTAQRLGANKELAFIYYMF